MIGKTLAHYEITSQLGKGGIVLGADPRRHFPEGGLRYRDRSVQAD